MSNEIRFIVNELNKPPYNKNYNLITFDALLPELLLQILNDVFAEIDQKNASDIREEDPEEMVVRMLGMLRILKYRPPEENKSTFRSGLVVGQKHVIFPILFWLLEKMEELKKRSYLAKYLVKIDVHPEILGDADVAEMVAKNEELIEQFKDIHREYENLKNSGFSTTELKRDISTIEEERDLVSRRIERMRQKTDGMPNQEGMLDSAKKLRQEKERQKEMSQQEVDLRSTIHMFDQRLNRLENQLKDMRKASVGTTPEALLQRLEEEVNVNNYIVKEKLPKELSSKEKTVATMQKVSNEPAMGQNEIDSINKKITSTAEEISRLNEARMKEVEEDESSEGKVGKLSFYRQNAVIIMRKKEQTAEKLSELRNDLSNAYEDLKEKEEELKEFSGEQILRGDEFKIYISKLRGKSSTYKLKKAELNELRAEYGILSRTEEILKAQEAQMDEQLRLLESSGGVSGFRETQDTLEEISSQKATVDERKGTTLTEMSDLVLELNQKIAERKSNLAPLLKEVRPLREKLHNFTIEYNDKKSNYDSVAAGLETNMSKLEQDVKNLRDDLLKTETKYHLDLFKKDLLSLKQKEAEEEIKIYLSKEPKETKKSLREQLMNEIAEQEKQGWMLKEEQKVVKDLAESSAKQLTMWQDVVKLIEVKRSCLENSRNIGNVMRGAGSEALVL